MALPRGFRMQVSWSNLLILILVIGITGGSALNQIYCSSQNTGSGPPEGRAIHYTSSSVDVEEPLLTRTNLSNEPLSVQWSLF